MGKLTLNGTEVKTQKVDGKTIVHIDTPDADIYINGVCVWSKYDKPEYDKVPAVLRSFIEGKNDFLKEENEKVVADLWLKDSLTCATFYMPKNTRDAIVARLDLITSMQDLEFEYLRNKTNIDDKTADSLVEEFTGLFKDIEDAVQSAGYKLAFSHPSGDFPHAWWDVIFPLKKWNEEAFLHIWGKFSLFNKRVNEIFEEYGQ